MPYTYTDLSPSERILQNLPEEYASKIPKALHRAIISKSNEIVRMVKSKTASGQELCKGDCIGARHAVALGFVLREGISTRNHNHNHGRDDFSISIPPSVLGKCVGQKKADAENISRTMTQLYLNNLSSRAFTATEAEAEAVPQTRAGRKRKILSRGAKLAQKMGQSKATRHTAKKAASSNFTSTSTSISTSTSTSTRSADEKSNAAEQSTVRQHSIPSSTPKPNPNPKPKPKTTAQSAQDPIIPKYLHEISMKLQSKLHDPAACETSASALFYQLMKYNLDKASTLATKRAVYQDFRVNSKMYDGCCFFIAAKEMEHGSLLNQGPGTGTGMGTKNKTMTKHSSSYSQVKGSVATQKRTLVKLYTQQQQQQQNNHEDEDILMDVPSLIMEDVANVLRVESSLMHKFLGDVLYNMKEMKMNNDGKRIINKKIQGRKKGSLSHPSLDKTMENNGGTVTGTGAGIDLDNVANMEPFNCNAIYRDRAKFEQWRNGQLERLTDSGEDREGAIDRLFSKIVQNHR